MTDDVMDTSWSRMRSFTIDIDHNCFADLYAASSPEIPGLLVMGKNVREVIAKLPEAIAELDKERHARHARGDSE